MKNQKSAPRTIVYGVHPILELLRAKRRPLYQLYTTDPAPRALTQLKPLIPKHVPITIAKKEVLTRLAETADHQSLVAITAPFPLRKKAFTPNSHPFLLLIDGVQDTRNLGAILRSSFCAGVSGVILSGSHAAPLNGPACKAAAGLSEHLEIMQYPSAISAANDLKKAGYQLYLGALGGESVRTISFSPPLCIVVGNEATGISPQLLTLGQKVMLPQRSAEISYNASVAAGILLFLAATKNGFIE
ncbi:MAG: RNA methyltransferase [Candidatus Dependentiae bacterium]|nr:RNA methyltransferase [Candidatus Dependentiae bacterium]